MPRMTTIMSATAHTFTKKSDKEEISTTPSKAVAVMMVQVKGERQRALVCRTYCIRTRSCYPSKCGSSFLPFLDVRNMRPVGRSEFEPCGKSVQLNQQLITDAHYF